eukprot:GFUD01010835.1.p1 GENE.GFUD01010835.1~~GFUD01010835.1.p1  ORF type:complete len:882 (-),score=215.59 GFUD01010835.1:60-2705(-)
MENEGILLRQAQHMKRLIFQLNDQIFAERFGDIKLIFADGDLHCYKALLAEISHSWGQILKSSDEADLVLLKEVKREEFLSQMKADVGKELDSLVDDELANIKVEDMDIIEEFDNIDYLNNDEVDDEDSLMERKDEISNQIDTPEEKAPRKEILKINSSEVSKTFHEQDVQEFVDLQSSEAKMVGCVIPNFSWPNHVNGPNFHSIRWGSSKSTQVYEVMGNRSIFTVLSEKHKNLPHSTTFSFRYSEEQEKSGIFYLKDFVNSGADQNVAVFMVEETEKKVTLKELIKCCNRIYKEEKEEIDGNTKNITILLGGEKFENLKGLTKIWRVDLFGDTADQKLVGEARVDKDVISWLRTQARRTNDGCQICCYCGFVCVDQSLSGNFQEHMKKHLYRKKFCKACNEHYLPQETHICKSQETVKAKRVHCSECDETLSCRSNLVLHLKRIHNIIEKVVTLRECLFCFKKVPNLSNHYAESHKNEELVCQFCDKTFSNPTKFKSHVDMAHKKIYLGFCNICQKECANLLKHNIQCHNEKTYKCDHCEKVFKHAKTLEDHMKSVNGTREKKPCPECGNLYVNVNDHVRRFHRGYKKNVMKRKSCNSCCKQIRRDEYDDHKVTCNKAPEETICHICSKKVVQIGKHLAMVHKVFDRRCYLCDKDFYTVLDLNSHLRSEHFPEILIEAEFLETDLLTEDKIQRECIAAKIVELYSSKTEENKVECKFCRYKTTTAINMITHMKEHLGYTFRKGKQAALPEQEKVCPDCGKIIKIMAVHAKSCKKILEKLEIQDGPDRGLLGLTVDKYIKFKDMNISLEEEKNTNDTQELLIKHTEKTKITKKGTNTNLVKQNDFPCDQCLKIFKKQANLRKHIEKVHGEKQYSFELQLR